MCWRWSPRVHQMEELRRCLQLFEFGHFFCGLWQQAAMNVMTFPIVHHMLECGSCGCC
jgi:hypothetical protein